MTLSLLLDTDGDGTFETDISARALRCKASYGVPQSAQLIEAAAGSLTALLTLDDDDAEIKTGYGIRMLWDGNTLWTGTARAPEIVQQGRRKRLKLTAIGNLSKLQSAKLANDVTVVRGNLLEQKLRDLLAAAGLSGVQIETDVVTLVGNSTTPKILGKSGESLLSAVNRLCLNTSTFLAEAPNGALQIHKRAHASASELVFSAEPRSGENIDSLIKFTVSRPENILLANSIQFGEASQVNQNSINREGTLPFTGSLEFVENVFISEVLTSLANLYEERFRVADTLGYLGLFASDASRQEAGILASLYYGSRAEVSFYDGSELVPGEAINTSYEAVSGNRLKMRTLIREVGTHTNIAVSIATVMRKEVFLNFHLPRTGGQENRRLTGYKIQYKLHTAGAYTTAKTVRPGVNGYLSDRFLVPSENIYDIRIVLTSDMGDEIISLPVRAAIVNLTITQPFFSSGIGRYFQYGVNATLGLAPDAPAVFRDNYVGADILAVVNRGDIISEVGTQKRLLFDTSPPTSWAAFADARSDDVGQHEGWIICKARISGYRTYSSPFMTNEYLAAANMR